MRLEISRRELLAGTEAYRRLCPDEKETRRSKLRELRQANATMNEPDIKFVLEAYGDVLDRTIVASGDWPALLRKCATPIGRDEFKFWFGLSACSEVLNAELRGMFFDGVVDVYCQRDQRHLLVCDIDNVNAGSWFFVYPRDTATDFLAEDESVDPDRDYDFGDSASILSALISEWIFGRPKSTYARDYICSICEAAEGVSV